MKITAPIVASCVFSALLGSVAWGQNPGGDRVQSERNATNDPSAMKAEQEAFVKTMLMKNLAEAELGKLVAQRTANPDIKSYAQMMVTDHTKANDDLRPIALSLGIEAPTQVDDKHRKESDRLSRLQGTEFDREYVKLMADAHRDALRETRAMAAAPTTLAAPATASGANGTSGSVGTSGRANDGQAAAPTLATQKSAVQFALKTSPVIQRHLDEAERLEKTIAKK
jgi:predicted outer membrane protein